MLGFDSELGTSALRLWVAAGSAALLLVVCVLVFARSGAPALTSGLRSAVVVLGALLGATIAWAFLNQPSARDRSAERRALEARAQELTAAALAPGSALACLDTLTGETVGAACEKELFASSATVATALSYVAARFTLLSDMAADQTRGDADIGNAMVPLRGSLEGDRFGFLAHVLAVRDGCTGESCNALALLRDPSHVRDNLSGATLDRYVEHYATAWTQPTEGPLADATGAQPSALTQPGTKGRKVMVNIDFPTAASIPPVSIMDPEPTGRAPIAAAAAGGNGSAPAATARRSRKQAANPPAQAVAPAAGAEAQVDPVWTPAPAANTGTGATRPIQLSPFATAPDSAMRTE